MYSVVGCRDCDALWVVEGRPDTTECPRCGTRRQFSKLRTFAEHEDADAARQARAAMLARRQGESEAFASLDPFDALERQVEDAGMDDEEYLDAAGVDADAAADAARRAERGSGRGGPGRVEVVREALRELDTPGEDDVAAYAREHGVDAEFAREALARLVRRGEASEQRGAYRLL